MLNFSSDTFLQNVEKELPKHTLKCTDRDHIVLVFRETKAKHTHTLNEKLPSKYHSA